jgi:hypothetical protein
MHATPSSTRVDGLKVHDASLQSERSMKSAAEVARTIVLGNAQFWQNEAKNINEFKGPAGN